MKHVPRMIKSPWLPRDVNGKKVLVRAVTLSGLELNRVAEIVASGLNPEGLMHIEIIVTYDSRPWEKTQAVFLLSERQAKRLKRSDNDEYDFVYEGILEPEAVMDERRLEKVNQ
jgi:hypothetical protein